MLLQGGTDGEAATPAFVYVGDGSYVAVGCAGILEVGSWSSQQPKVCE
jgi:hypothetical protein